MHELPISLVSVMSVDWVLSRMKLKLPVYTSCLLNRAVVMPCTTWPCSLSMAWEVSLVKILHFIMVYSVIRE